MTQDKTIRKNFNYFKTKLLDKYFVFKVGTNDIVVKVSKDNFSHLIGIKYSSKGRYYMLRSEMIYHILETSHEIDNLSDLVDENKISNKELNESEQFFVNKNNNFIYLFESLVSYNNYQLYLYKKDAVALFDADYLYCEIVDDFGTRGYIGLIGEEKTNYYRFNSIYIDFNSRIIGIKRKVESFSIVSKDVFNEDNYNFMPSPRNVNNIKHKDKVFKTKPFKIDNGIINNVNKQLNDHYKLIKGSGKATQYCLTLEKEILIKDFQLEPFEPSVNGIVKYITDKYPDSIKRK